ncbi:hypothetical protein CWE09_01545 [Aliidiomarina minuta]|uniref:Uncharacterized protein n=1 Tax=Aliidiomarina minuta TaxID=880057 RepID=A0A432W5W1_9GAMM|nr:YdbH domain-containing protein [Aliidiomarina minuta]RUO25447.1 hypothetical protein CWE09_01545 [Aliidiomarina minuta]
MRRFLIIVSLLAGVLLASGVAAWLYLQHQLKQLPISQLNYEFSSLGTRHVGLSELSFIYHDQNLRMPVQVEQMHLSWQWLNWRPQLEIVVIEKINLSLNQFPDFGSPAEESSFQLPDDWTLPGWLPETLNILDAQLQLPCTDNTCNYYAELLVNNQQQLDINLRLNPGQQPNEEQQLSLDVQYSGHHQQPDIRLYLAAEQQLDLQLYSDIKSGRFQVTAQPPAEWLQQELLKWGLQFSPAVYNRLHEINNEASLEGSWQSNLTDDFDLQLWSQYLNATLSLQAIIPEQLRLAVDTSLQSDDWSGSLYVQVLPQATALFREFYSLPPSVTDNIEQSLLSSTESPSLSSQWYFALDRQLDISDWYQQLNGALQLEANSPTPVNIPSIGSIQGQANAEIHLHNSHISHYQLDASGILSDPDYNELVQPYGLQPGNLQWQVNANNELAPALNALPLQIKLQSQGDTELQLNSEILLNLEEPAIRASNAQVQLTQQEYHWQDLSLQNVQATFGVNFSWQPDQLTLSSSQPLHLNFSLQDAQFSVEALQLNIPHWQVQGDPQYIDELSLTANMNINFKSLQQELLQTQNWSWQGQLRGTLQELNLTAELSNESGLRLRHEALLNTEQLLVDWQLSDIFLLAGNPLAETLADWPELLTLQRGRGNASGQLRMPLTLNAGDINQWQVTATLGVSDLAGVYNTTEFSGLNAQFAATLDNEKLALSLPQLQVENIRQGLDFGPFELAATYYAAALDSPFSGQLNLQHNQLALFNGSLSLENRIYHLADEVLEAQLVINQVDLNQLLLQYPASDISGSGLLSGTIPVQWDSEGISVVQGRLGALPPGGQLQFRSQQATDMAASNPGVKIAVDALEDFHYSILDSGVSYQTDGTLLLAVRLHGHNPDWQQGHPINLNITLQENLPDLITSLQLSNQVSTIIQERVQQRVLQSRNR